MTQKTVISKRWRWSCPYEGVLGEWRYSSTHSL